jgi:hypothetical protein
MAIPQHKKDYLTKTLGVPEDKLAELEQANAQEAAAAREAGVQSKEKQPDTVAAEDPAARQAAAPVTGGEEKPDAITREEIATAIVAAQAPILEAQKQLAEAVAALTKEIAGLKETDEAKVKAVAENTPTASIAALIAKQYNPIGAAETRVDGRSALAKDKPQETEPSPPARYGIPILDQLLTAPNGAEQSE